MTSKQCDTCKLDFPVRNYRKDDARFCSYTCYWNFTKSQIPPSHLTCTKCKSTKEFKFFHKSRQGKFGRKSYCSACARGIFNNWRLKNYKKINEKRKNYYKTVLRDPKFYFNRTKRAARQRGIDFDISLDFFLSLWNDKCKYCGDIVSTAGIDRIDSKIGYTSSNCVRCCTICNKAKNNLNIEEFINHCKKIIKHVTLS